MGISLSGSDQPVVMGKERKAGNRKYVAVKGARPRRDQAAWAAKADPCPPGGACRSQTSLETRRRC